MKVQLSLEERTINRIFYEPRPKGGLGRDVAVAKVLTEAFAEIREAVFRQLNAAESELRRLGFRPCDVAACNCGGWHQHRPTVIEESLTAQVAALKADRDHWREEHEHRRSETLAALMVEKAAQDRAEVVTEAAQRAIDALALNDSDAYALHPDTADKLNSVRCDLQNALARSTLDAPEKEA